MKLNAAFMGKAGIGVGVGEEAVVGVGAMEIGVSIGVEVIIGGFVTEGVAGEFEIVGVGEGEMLADVLGAAVKVGVGSGIGKVAEGVAVKEGEEEGERVAAGALLEAYHTVVVRAAIMIPAISRFCQRFFIILVAYA